MSLPPRNRLPAWCRRGLLLSVGASLAVSAWGHAVVLHLRNGDRLTGTVLASEPSRITLSNSVLGRMVVPLDQVARQEPVAVEVAVATPEAATNALPARRAAELAALEDRLKSLQVAYLSGELSAEEYHRRRALIAAQWARTNGTTGPGSAAATGAVAAGPPLVPSALRTRPTVAVSKRWSGEAQFGTDLGFGQKGRQLYSGRLKLNYGYHRVHEAMDFLSTYGRTDGELSANRMDGSSKFDFDVSKAAYLYFIGGAGYDEVRKIDWRYEVGPGLGFRLVTRTNLTLRVEGGMHYQVHSFQGNREDQLYSQRLAQDLRWNLGTLFSFDEKVEYLPGVDSFGEYKLRAEANLRYWLRSNLALTLTVIDFYDTVTAKGVGQNDIQFRSSLGVKF